MDPAIRSVRERRRGGDGRPMLDAGSRRIRLGSAALLLCAASIAAAEPVGADEGSGGAGQLTAAESRAEAWRRLRQEKAAGLEPDGVSGGEAFFRWLETRRPDRKIFVKGFVGFRPLIGGMPSGAGLVGGLGWTGGRESEILRVDLAARHSTRDFKELEGAIEFPGPALRSPLTAFLRGGYRDYPSLFFFGLGEDSREEDRSFYRSEERFASGGLELELWRFLELRGEAGYLDPDVSAGRRSPSLDRVFDPDGLPGFESRPEFRFYQLGAEIDIHDLIVPKMGILLAGGFERWDDRDGSEFAFDRWSAEAQLHLPLLHRNRILAARLRATHATPDPGHEVPFYLMKTIGGAKTLRGYQEYRFRDRGHLLLNVEYRWEVWTQLDFAAFADWGKAFRDSGDLDFQGLHHAYGVGMRIHVFNDALLRIDLARSPEGTVLHVSGGPSF